MHKPQNELYDAGLPEVPTMTQYEHDLPHSYWDKQYAQAESGHDMLYPHTNYFLDQDEVS